MPLETPVNTIWDLVATNPADGDFVLQGDNHLRNIKRAMKNTFLIDERSNLPMAGTQGRFFNVTDQDIILYDTGSEWIPLGGTFAPIEVNASVDPLIPFRTYLCNADDPSHVLPTKTNSNQGDMFELIFIGGTGYKNLFLSSEDDDLLLTRLFAQNDHVTVYYNGTDFIVIDLQQFCSLAAFLPANFPLVQGTHTLIDFSEVIRDTTSSYLDGVFQVPISGIYEISPVVEMLVTGNQLTEISVFKNGNVFKQVGLVDDPGSATDHVVHSGKINIQVQLNDEIDLRGRMNKPSPFVRGDSNGVYSNYNITLMRQYSFTES